MTLLPVIDEYSCCGQGDCAELAPEVFRVDDVAAVVGGGPPELLRAAAEACPTSAIALVDRESGAQVYP
jgi:ferredoxin